MIVTISRSTPCGSVAAPPSKSFAHRALILGAFSQKSVIKNIAFSNDIKATLSCLRSLGAAISVVDDTVTAGGIDLSSVSDGTTLYCSESGSTLRFLIPVCLLTGREITLFGTEKLMSRPLDEYERLCKEQGFRFEKKKDCLTLCGKLNSGKYCLKADSSTQFITGMMLALSQCSGKSEITVSGEIESLPYIDITVKAMRDFGIDVRRDNNIITLSGGKRPESTGYTVEGDASNAAYLAAFGLLGKVAVSGVRPDTVQGDIVYEKYFEDLKNGVGKFDLKNCPDLAPCMFAACCLFGGAEFTGTRRLKFKESDRVLTMAKELKKFGAKVVVGEDSVRITADSISPPSETLLGHNDHRIVMALSLLCAKFGGVIDGAEAVEKSFPDFFNKISQIGIGVKNDA